MSNPGDFLKMLDTGHAIVLKEFPQAQLYEADWNRGQPELWRFVYNDPATAPNSTIILNNVKGQFEPPRHIDSPWLEDRVIPFPVPMNLSVAEALAKKAGFDGDIAAITLRWPLYPESHEPCYILGIPSQHVHVFVGVYTHQVSTSPLSA